MNIATSACRAWSVAALLAAGANLQAAGYVAACSTTTGRVAWTLTLDQDLKGGNLVMSSGPSPDGGSAIARKGDSWNVIPGRPYKLFLQNLKKEDTSLKFRLADTRNRDACITLSVAVGDGNASLNPIYRAVIKKITYGSFFEGTRVKEVPAANWSLLLDLDDLAGGDLTIKGSDLSVLNSNP